MNFLFLPLPPIEHNGYYYGKRLDFFIRIKIFLRELLVGKNNRYKIKLFILLVKHFYVLILNFFFFPIIAILYIFNIRVLNIMSWQIGAFIHQLDTLVKNNKSNKKFKLIFFAPSFICEGQFITTLYNKEVTIIRNKFLYFLFFSLIHSRIISLEPWDFETHNKNSVFNKVHNNYNKIYKNFNLNLNKKFLVNSFLEINKKKIKKTICIHLRDELYKNSNKVRNVDFETLLKSVKFLLRNGYYVTRFINKSSKTYKIKNKKYHEMLISSENDKRQQYYIMDNCRLVIGSQSGVLNYNLTSQTSYFLTNAIPINNLMVIKKNDFYIFKKFLNVKTKKYLSLKEILKLNLNISPEKRDTKLIKIINNSSNEILESVKEIFKQKKINKSRKNTFLKLIKETSAFHTKANICNSFLEKNSEILK